MKPHEEAVFEIAPGKTIILKLLSVGSPNAEGMRTVFFKVNGQTRNVEIVDKNLGVEKVENEKAEPKDANQIGAPLQGLLSKVLVKNGQKVKQNEALFVIEAMKMETTITAVKAGKVNKINLKEGTMVFAEDLIITMD